MGRRSRARRRERGAVLVEMSIVATVFITLTLGVFEIGMAWSDHQAVTQAARAGARVGSQLGTAGEADRGALLATEASLGSVGTVERIVVFEADANGDMPAACETAPVGYSGAANCNVYDATSLANLSTLSLWGSGSSCGSADGNWCSATERDAALASATYLGVLVEIRRSYLTGFFGGGTHTISEYVVMRLEPAGT